MNDMEVQRVMDRLGDISDRLKRVESKFDAGLISRDEVEDRFVTKAELKPISLFVYFIMGSLGVAILGALWKLLIANPAIGP